MDNTHLWCIISIQSDHNNGSYLRFESKSYTPMFGNPNFKKSGATLEKNNILEFCLCLCSKGKKPIEYYKKKY